MRMAALALDLSCALRGEVRGRRSELRDLEKNITEAPSKTNQRQATVPVLKEKVAGSTEFFSEVQRLQGCGEFFVGMPSCAACANACPPEQMTSVLFHWRR